MKHLCGLVLSLCLWSSTVYAYFDVYDLYFNEFNILTNLQTENNDEITCDLEQETLVCKTSGGDKYSGLIYNTYDDGIPKSDVLLKDGKPDGLWHIFYPDRNFLAEISFHNGLVDGSVHGLYPHGGLRTLGRYTKGQANYILNVKRVNNDLVFDGFIKYQLSEAVFNGSFSPKALDAEVTLTEGTTVSVMKMAYKDRNLLGKIKVKDGTISGSGDISVVGGRLSGGLKAEDTQSGEFLNMAYKGGKFTHSTNTKDPGILKMIDTLSKVLK